MATDSNSAPIFAGEFRHALDTKNRITIPARWRKGESDEFYVVPHQELSCLIALPPSEFQAVRDVAKTLPREAQADFLRNFASRSQLCTTDKAGRMVLSEEQCKTTGLNGEVFLVGAVDRFEVWSPAAWQEFKDRSAQSYKEVAKSVGL